MANGRVFQFIPEHYKSLLLANALLLLLAIPVWFYDYYCYMLIRLVVTLISACLVYLFRNESRKQYWFMIAATFVFNPILLTALRAALIPADVILAACFYVISRQPKMFRVDITKGSNQRLKHILIAWCVSLAVGVSIVASLKLNLGGQYEPTIHDRINQYLATPIFPIASKLVSAKSLGNIVYYMWTILLGAMLFYGIITWLALLLWARMRTGKTQN